MYISKRQEDNVPAKTTASIPIKLCSTIKTKYCLWLPVAVVVVVVVVVFVGHWFKSECREYVCMDWDCWWLQCSARCGEGRRSRTVSCVLRKRRVVDDRLCHDEGLRRPATVQRCHGRHCSSQFHWMSSDWSQVRYFSLCQASCSSSTRSICCGFIADLLYKLLYSRVWEMSWLYPVVVHLEFNKIEPIQFAHLAVTPDLVIALWLF